MKWFFLFLCVVVICSTIESSQKEVKVNAREYQLECDPHGINVYDGAKWIGRLQFEKNPQLDSLLAVDNE